MTYAAANLNDDGTGSKSTLASTVYHQLRADLLRGAFETESKLRVEWVVSKYGAGASPVREALNRLASEGLLGRHDQRGFFIMPVSAAELEELTRTRCWLEERALRESIAHRTAEWEEQLVLALHRLGRTSRLMPTDLSSLNPDWERLHRTFHRALISACRSRWLVGFCDQLSDHAYRYRRMASNGEGVQRDDFAEHRLIAENALDGNADAAVEALLNHYRLTAAMCMERFKQVEASEPASARAERTPR
ncbi:MULTISPECIES: GntR family transcriptional regulator [unclassified Mesorhizobium]|uniref:GntR family transcriptional regulator n=1 Tax=unclassified Mesorhizobium TaxID=325217 RepID=UPI0011282EEC|nr:MULTISPECIES: GntR family transcriptional regulator [unclassified Mesorhizobium]TPJ43297.1 GntR family transcriptional regulator [Mesorhizobium sp. B2-6-6]MBZ9979792.1 GntR family transcriptional regulator [Mesorhizobium sp. BR-1-1-8]MBZ9999365.1 GntR family transcriptional regulator [Mesorhizobium sp. B264B2A]MCA0007355.1 GntR family transcriptional regulator [Mesorhizobium sp. B264B1B]MCA0022557.1 GntR family transcriptional regulator [Mesorhizobium sp. B264B1A]